MSYYNNNNNNGYDNNTNNGYNNHASANDYYNQHPQQYENSYPNYSENVQPPADRVPEDGNRGLLGAVGGSIGGGILGKQTNHGFLGGVGGALVGSLAEDFLKKRHSRPSSPQPPAAVAVATATATANSYGGNTPLATPMSPPTYHHTATLPTYGTPGGYGGSTSTTTTATSYFQQPPCMATPHPCPGNVHHCAPAQNHNDGHHHSGGAVWNAWHK